MSIKYVQAVELGRENLTLRTLVALAAPLDVDPATLLLTPTTAAAKRGRPKLRAAPAFEEVEPPGDLFRTCVPLLAHETDMVRRDRPPRAAEVEARDRR